MLQPMNGHTISDRHSRIGRMQRRGGRVAIDSDCLTVPEPKWRDVRFIIQFACTMSTRNPACSAWQHCNNISASQAF